LITSVSKVKTTDEEFRLAEQYDRELPTPKRIPGKRRGVFDPLTKNFDTYLELTRA